MLAIIIIAAIFEGLTMLILIASYRLSLRNPDYSLASAKPYLIAYMPLGMARLLVNWRKYKLDMSGSSQKLLIVSRLKMFEDYIDKHRKITQYISWRRHEFGTNSPIVFKNVSLTVGYKPILKKVSFKLNPLSRVGIIGSIGAGRSTILQILSCMKEPDDNKQTFISILGVPIQHFDTRLMKDVFLIE